MSQVAPIDQTAEGKEPEKGELQQLDTGQASKLDTSSTQFHEALKELQDSAVATHTLSSAVNCLAYTAAGAAAGLKNGKVVVLGVGEMRGNLHKGSVTCIAAVPEKGILLTAGDRSVKAWSLTELSDVATMAGHSSWVHSLCVSPNSEFAVSGSTDRSAKVWSLQDFSLKATLEGHRGEVSCLSITPDSQYLVTASWDSTLKLWSCESWAEVATFSGHKGHIDCIVLTLDGSSVASGSQDCTVRLWSLQHKAAIAVFEGHTKPVRAVAATRKLLMSASFDKTVRVWSIDDKREVATLAAFEKMVQSIDVSPGGRYIVASGDSVVRLWDFRAFEEVATLEGHTKFVQCVAFSADGRRLASGGQDNSVKIWDIHSPKALEVLPNLESLVVSVAVTRDGQYLVCAADKSVKLWSFATEREVRTYLGHTKYVQCVTLTPDDRCVVSGSKDKTMILWDLRSGELIYKFTGHTGPVNCIAVTKDARVALSGSIDRDLRAWSLVDKRELAVLAGHEDDVRSVVTTPDSQYAISASRDSTVKIWSLVDYQLLESLSMKAHCLCLTPDGSKVLAASGERALVVWDFASRRQVAQLAGHEARVWALAISADGRFAVSGATDKQVKVWSLEELREVVAMEYHGEGVTAVAFTADCKAVISSSWDKTVRRFDISSVTHQLEISQDPTCSLFTANSRKLIFGNLVHPEVQKYRVGRLNINSLHVSAYFNRSLRCAQYLKAGVPLIKGVFGSALTVALARNAGKSMDAILEHLSARDQTDSDWLDFRAVADDLPQILSRNSSFIVPLCERLFCRTAQAAMPAFLTPVSRLPITVYIASRNAFIRDFAQFAGEEMVRSNASQVEFWISTVRWNFLPGSEDSLRFLKAIKHSRHYRQLLSTPFLSALVQKKWAEVFVWACALTALYALMLIVLVAIVFSYWRTDVLASFFIALNGALLGYEVLQMVGTRGSYVSDIWNAIDLLRSLLSLTWSGLILSDTNPQYLRLAVVFLCFLRGFTYFRTFTPTRIFVNITLQVMQDIYSFLLILAYSVFAFGVMAAVVSEDESATYAWTDAFSMLMGGFDNSSFGLMQWVIFVAANVVNVIVMLNLLISIIGDAYDRAQVSLAENDNHEMIGVVLEFESIMFWRRSKGQPAILVQCRPALGTGHADEWEGRVKAIATVVKQGQAAAEKQLQSGLAAIESLLKPHSALESQVAALTQQVAAMQRQLEAIDSKLASRS